MANVLGTCERVPNSDLFLSEQWPEHIWPIDVDASCKRLAATSHRWPLSWPFGVAGR